MSDGDYDPWEDGYNQGIAEMREQMDADRKQALTWQDQVSALTKERDIYRKRWIRHMLVHATQGARLMKAWCKNCDTERPASFRPAKDYVTGHDYEDLCCDDCHFVIATVCDREQDGLAHVTKEKQK